MHSNTMPTLWLPIPHCQQRNKADCLVACVLMVLEYLGDTHTTEQVIQLFDMDPDLGVPASRIKRLEQWGLHVLYETGTMSDLRQHLAQKEPCIVFVNTIHLPYWEEMTRHALVVTGIDEHYVYLNDPFFDEAPQSVTHLEFLLAWDEFENTYAVIHKIKHQQAYRVQMLREARGIWADRDDINAAALRAEWDRQFEAQE